MSHMFERPVQLGCVLLGARFGHVYYYLQMIGSADLGTAIFSTVDDPGTYQTNHVLMHVDNMYIVLLPLFL